MEPNTQFQTNPAPPPVATGLSSADKYKRAKTKLIIVSALLAIIILVAVFLAVKAIEGTTRLDASYNNGYSVGQKDQAKVDETKIKQLNENPFRSYTAPQEVGSFTVQFPRNWNISISSKTAGNAFTALFLPDYVDLDTNTYALRIMVQNQLYDDQLKKFESAAKSSKNKLTESAIQVSDVKGEKFRGLIDQKTANGTVVILPLRDKTFIIQTDDNAKYGSYFDDIVAKIKVNP